MTIISETLVVFHWCWCQDFNYIKKRDWHSLLDLKKEMAGMPRLNGRYTHTHVCSEWNGTLTFVTLLFKPTEPVYVISITPVICVSAPG